MSQGRHGAAVHRITSLRNPAACASEVSLAQVHSNLVCHRQVYMYAAQMHVVHIHMNTSEFEWTSTEALTTALNLSKLNAHRQTDRQTHTHTPAQVLRQAPGSCNSDVRSFCRVVGFTLCCKLLSQRVMAF